jgi:Fic family protein
MTNKRSDTAARDDGESIGLFEPIIVSQGSKLRPKLDDLANSLAERSSALRSTVPPAIGTALAHIVAIANSYYSNLIEGHHTHPLDIERALNDDYSDDAGKRDLQLEARAHVAVQEQIDAGSIGTSPFTVEAICEIHRRFCELLPPKFLLVDTGTGRDVHLTPGATRTSDVKIGRHLAISPGAVPRFLHRLEEGYKTTGRAEKVLVAACGHHRLLWVHPFLDANGRVARLASHAALGSTIEGATLWSIARGLALQEREYRAHLQACDEPRRGSLDGRGSLSEGALASFAEFFIETCIAQSKFMQSLLEPRALRERILKWTLEEVCAGALPEGSTEILEAVLRRGELDRSEMVAIAGGSEKAAWQPVAALAASGVVQSETPSSALQLRFPVRLATRFLPGLFPTTVDAH